jgi:hypothetical protein
MFHIAPKSPSCSIPSAYPAAVQFVMVVSSLLESACSEFVFV